jgi:hypothetical protein
LRGVGFDGLKQIHNTTPVAAIALGKCSGGTFSVVRSETNLFLNGLIKQIYTYVPV